MALTSPDLQTLLHGMTVLERGWLSSNNVLLHGTQPGEPGEPATLVDSGHLLHAPQTLALVQQTLHGATLGLLVNTHLHSDHCGGNATLQRAYGCPVHIPPGGYAAVCAWDEAALSYRATGQLCERFVPSAQLLPGSTLLAGARRWQVLAAPGHDPDSVILFDAQNGVLISADALWENGFGVVFPELEGERAFDDVGDVLQLIERLQPRVVIPGHGAPFVDVAGALQRAHRRLATFKADPARHAHHGMKVLVKYHLMEVQQQPLPQFLAWLDQVPLCRSVWQRVHPQAGGSNASFIAYGQQVVQELVASGALAQRGELLLNV
jgi:glyoxylase-like metal-dependent hydrolase (beta-lactamase superfamily II)